MKILLPQVITNEIIEALKQAGYREIGGIMMGEHVGKNIFRVTEITIQKKGGSFARFVRFVDEMIKPLRSFFDKHKRDYKHFNYIGEWHSHHSFSLTPSLKDHNTMLNIVTDNNMGANFIALMIVKLNPEESLGVSVTFYLPNKLVLLGNCVLET